MGDAKISELLGSTGAFLHTIIYLEGYSRVLRLNLFLFSAAPPSLNLMRQ